MKKEIYKLLRQPSILCFSIIVTGRCNARCSYCHFYGLRKKELKAINKDIEENDFYAYIKLIKKIKAIIPKTTKLQIRFSGGDPLVLGDKVFKLSNYCFKEIGIKPYVLTNGIAINQSFIRKAQKYHIGCLLVSLENPFNKDSGAPDQSKVLKNIKKYNTRKLPIMPGVSVISNDQFKNLYRVCKYFYNKLGQVPTISELSFHAFEIPTKKQLKDLGENIVKIYKNFGRKTQLVLFPYISPEISDGGKKQFLIELDLNNKDGLTEDNINQKINKMLYRIEERFPRIKCKNNKCEWREFCDRYKWVWDKSFNKNMTVQQKRKAYCDLKKTINNAFIEGMKIN